MTVLPQIHLQTPLTVQGLRDIKPPLDVSDSQLFYILLAALILIAIVAVVWIYIQKRRPVVEPVPTEEIVENPPHKIAFEQLNKLKDSPCDVQTYHTRISYILREYIAARYHIPALALTTTHLLKWLISTQNGELNIERIQHFFNNCDTVKFAMRQPESTETDARMEDAWWFIDVTTPKS